MGGNQGGRVFSNRYKGHMDKTKGCVGSSVGSEDSWGLGELWAQNGDNCT